MHFRVLVVSMLYTGLIYGQSEFACKAILDTLSNEIVYENPSIYPQPKSGMEALYKKLKEALAIETTVNIEGAPHELSVVGFVVCSDGEIRGERIIKKSPLPNLEEQIIQLVRTLEWKPGLCEDQKVNVLMELPMRIRIDN